MGGLVTEKLLLTYRDKAPDGKVPAIFLYGTPLEGSNLANFARLLNSDPLLRELQTGDRNLLLHDIDQQWLHVGFEHIKRFCAYEKLPEDGVVVVDQNSATRGCTDQMAVNSNHRDLVKPCNAGEHSYTWLKNQLKELELAKQSSVIRPLGLTNQSLTAGSSINAPPPSYAQRVRGPAPYEEVKDMHARIDVLSQQWTQDIVQLQRQFAEPYKYGPLRGQPFPKTLPDVLVDRLNRQAWEITGRYTELQPALQKARQDANTCMQLTPNQQIEDIGQYNAANRGALEPPSVATLQNNTPDTSRFNPMTNYLTNLEHKVGDFHCEMSAGPGLP